MGPEDTEEDDGDLRINTDLTFEEVLERVLNPDEDDSAE